MVEREEEYIHLEVRETYDNGRIKILENGGLIIRGVYIPPEKFSTYRPDLHYPAWMLDENGMLKEEFKRKRQ